MGTFKIKGGSKLRGEIVPQGAKNEALQILCATLLTSEPVILHNVPEIHDVSNLMKLLKLLGSDISSPGKKSCRIETKNINIEAMRSKEYVSLATSIRGSVMILGPLLAREGKGFLPQPGGDKIGRRRLDTHLHGLEKLGAEFRFDASGQVFHVIAKNLRGAHILLDEASVTGTANVLMGADGQRKYNYL